MVGASASIGGLVLGVRPALAATPGSAIADLQWNGTYGLLNVKAYGAGWPYGTLRTTYRVYRNGALWRTDSRVKYYATSINYGWAFECGDGFYQMRVEIWGPYGTYNWDDDSVWAR